MRNLTFRLIAAILGFLTVTLLSTFRVEAGFVTYDYTGVITSGSVEFSAFAGTMAMGSISYDTSTVANAGATSTNASYDTGSITLLVASKGFSYHSDLSTTTVVSMPGIQDSFMIASNGGYGEQAFFNLIDTTGSVFPSSSLPLSLNLADFQPRSGDTISYSAHHAFGGFDLTIDALVPGFAIPEPPSVVMVGIASALGLIFAARGIGTRCP